MDRPQFSVTGHASISPSSARVAAPPTAEEMLEALVAEGVDLHALLVQAGPGHFIHVAPGQDPLIVEHATGRAVFRVVDGKLAPIDRG